MMGKDLLVVKIGGGEGLDLAATCDDLATIVGERPLVVVHGVSAIMNQLCVDLGVEVQTLSSPSGHSSRYTPPAVRDVYVSAAEIANAELVSALHQRGIFAAGLINSDVALQAERKQAIRAVVNGRVRVVRDDHSGSIRRVEVGRICELLNQKGVPVLPPMANSDDGLLNVDGDRASAAVAGALQAKTLIILSNVRGLYQHFPDESSFVAEVPKAQIDRALSWAQGRMKRKVLAAEEALNQGIETVIIADGRVRNPVSRALAGAGTRFTA